jgi:hypothetical protein
MYGGKCFANNAGYARMFLFQLGWPTWPLLDDDLGRSGDETMYSPGQLHSALHRRLYRICVVLVVREYQAKVDKGELT